MATSQEARGWQVGKTLTQCLLHMLHNQVSTDVTFIIEPPADATDHATIRIPAHKFVLSARSPVFEAMFSGNYAESSEDVKIVDAEEGPFREMLRYMYTEEVNLTGDNVLQVLNIAKKYFLEGLRVMCTEFLKNKLCVDNVCDMLNNSVKFGDEELVDKCLTLSVTETAAVVKSDGFLNMSQPALQLFLANDKLQNDQEEAIVSSCLKWADKKCEESGKSKEKICDVLGNCIHQMRYSVLTTVQLANLLGKSTMLTGEEKSLFFCYSATKEEAYLKQLAELGFNVTSRILIYNRSGSIYTGSMAGRLHYNDDEKIQISVSAPVICQGIRVHSGPKGFKHEINVNIFDEETGSQLGEVQSSITSTGQSILTAYFKEGVRLEPGTQYLMFATQPRKAETLFKTPDTSFGNLCQHVKTVSITSKTSQCAAYHRYSDNSMLRLGYIYSLLLSITL